MSMLQPLAEGPIDIVGDVHGEYDALRDLLDHLGYDAAGGHNLGRRLVFVGDLCDRGPASPDVFHLVEQLVRNGTAQAIAGNHELNLVNHAPKAGSGWFFACQRQQRNERAYEPCAQAGADERERILAFADQLPLILARADLRIVHAAWIDDAVSAVRTLQSSSVHGAYQHFQSLADHRAAAGNMHQSATRAVAAWDLTDPDSPPPMLDAWADYGVHRQMANPVKVLTSGAERKADKPFYTSGKWRFAERVPWWAGYDDATPVVVGHYWRQTQAPANRQVIGKSGPDLFAGVAPFAWMGQRHNVFCVDYSVGGRWATRTPHPLPRANFRLAALRWPERTLVFDDGSTQTTTGFGSNSPSDV